MVVALGSKPSSGDGFYAIHNQFLVSGPKGYTEFKMLENRDLFIRIDLPGVPSNGVKVCLDPTKKVVKVLATAPRFHKFDISRRVYGAVSGVVCKCCEISNFTSEMSEGVLRLILSKKTSTTNIPSCIAYLGRPEGEGGVSDCSGRDTFPHGTNPQDPALSGKTLQPIPIVHVGSKMAFEWKLLKKGWMFVRVDMPL